MVKSKWFVGAVSGAVSLVSLSGMTATNYLGHMAERKEICLALKVIDGFSITDNMSLEQKIAALTILREVAQSCSVPAAAQEEEEQI